MRITRDSIFCLSVVCMLLLACGYVHGKKKKPKRTPAAQSQPCDKTCGHGAKLNENLCRCVCQKGYRYDEYWVQCMDVDECADSDNECQGRCVNTAGSFECHCGIGYILHANGLQCLPEPRVVPCQALACYDGARLKVRKCECQCPEGLLYDFIREICYDVNECDSEDNRCDHCTNFYGGYACFCPDGQELADDGTTCVEVDYKSAAELACDSRICGVGSVLDLVHCECLCQEGFYYDEATETCVDENECTYEYCAGVCKNVPGTYRCTCPDSSKADSRGRCNTISVPSQCEPHERLCNNGTACYYESTTCDGYPDCSDGTDETRCKRLCYPQQFACANGQNCLDSWDVCNGVNDCGDNSDEIDCDCKDFNPKCRAWSIRDECTDNPAFMETTCRFSCGLCLQGYETESGTLTLKENPGLYFLRHSQEYARTTQYVLRNMGRRRGKAGNSWQCATVTDVPEKVRNEFRLSGFYVKYTHAYGIPILGSGRVSADALKRACYVTRFMLSDDRRVRQSLYDFYTRVVVIADTEVITNVPEYSHLPVEYNDLVRGLGGTQHMPVISVGEENLLCERRDPNKKEDFLVKTLAQGIYRIGELSVDVTRRFEFGLEEAFTYAREQRIWKQTRNDDTKEAYFSEGVQAFFDVQNPVTPYEYNDVDSRSKLKYYDTRLYTILREVFPCQNTIVDRCVDQAPLWFDVVIKAGGLDTALRKGIHSCSELKYYDTRLYTIVREVFPCQNNIVHRCGDQASVLEQTLRINCDVPVQVPAGRNEPWAPIYDPECQDNQADCHDWAERGECTNNPEWMLQNCKVSCENCDIINLPTTPRTPDDTDEDCVDQNGHCPDWAERGECEGNPAWMRPNCPRSCRACGQNPNCFDNNDLCPEWAANGNCEENEGYMGIYCQRSCNIC